MSITLKGIYDVNKYLFGTELDIPKSKEFVNNIIELAINNLKANYIKEYSVINSYNLEEDVVKITFEIVVKRNVRLKDLKRFKDHLECTIIL